MWKRIGRPIAGLAVVCALNGTPAQADPISIISGNLSYWRPDLSGFNWRLAGGGQLSGLFGRDESRIPSHACFPCTPGSSVLPAVDEALSIGSASDDNLGGWLEYQGHVYTLTTVRFTIDASSVVIPGPPPAGIGAVNFSGWKPFSFTGLAAGVTENGLLARSLLLAGQGNVRLGITSDSNWFTTEYRFEDPSAVPEPASLWLLGTGAAGLAMRLRRGRRRTVAARETRPGPLDDRGA